MEQHRMLIAIVLSLTVFLAWEFLFVDRDRPPQPPEMPPGVSEMQRLPQASKPSEVPTPALIAKPELKPNGASTDRKPRLITVQTPLYTAEFTEKGALLTRFVLKNYRESVEPDSALFKMVSATRVKVGETAGIALTAAGLPENVVARLRGLDPEGYKSLYLLEKALKDLLGEENARRYSAVIMKHVETMNIYDGTLRNTFLNHTNMDLGGALFRLDRPLDRIDISRNPQEISFSWQAPEGIKVIKTFEFSPETYLIGLRITVENGSDREFKDNLVLSLVKKIPKKNGGFFEGPSALINDRMQKIEPKKIKEKNIYTGQLKWIALQDRYFISSIIPVQPVETSMRLLVDEKNLVESQYIEPAAVIERGRLQSFDYKLFLGPKSLKVLGNVGYDMDKAVNFGWFDFIARPCVKLMNFLHGIIPNYGVAIVILTVGIKLLLWPLGAKSSRSMAKMKDLQPEMQKIRERYKHDRKKMNEEIMRLYKTFGANPMSGCLLMLPQIPVFFALYRMLYEAIELRHAPFFGWIDDLSAPDRLFHFDISIPLMEPPYGIPVLTVIMGATMFLQQKMQPMAGDPMQAKLMMMMPIVFTVIFINFSSGLVLYWLVNNVLTIAQQYYVTKKKA